MANVRELFDLTGKVALVSGAAGHLGRAIATALAEAGADVVTTSRDRTRAEAVAEELPTTGRQRHLGIRLDHLDEPSIGEGFEQALAEFGHVDIVVNNGHQMTTDDLTTISRDEFDGQLGNATGYFLLSRRFHDHVVERSGSGSLIFVSSMYSLVASYPDAYEQIGPANPVAYQVAKAGVNQMMRHLAVYWAKDGVRVNCISPGPFPGSSADQRLVSRLEEKSPMRRIGRPDELKGAVLYLASDASSYVTGHNLVVDGGWTAW